MSRTLALVVLAALAAPAALLAPSAQAASHTIVVSNFAFTDSESGSAVTSAHVGDTITFSLASGAHTATSGALGTAVPALGPVDSPILSGPVTTYSITLTTPGAFPYTCRFHPSMDGLIVAAP